MALSRCQGAGRKGGRDGLPGIEDITCSLERAMGRAKGSHEYGEK